MRFAVLVKASKESESGALPTAEEFGEMGKFNEDLAKAGVTIEAADGLQPSSNGVRLKFRGGNATVIDGPFAETKELVAGFWIVEAKSKQEIIERFSRAPFDNDQEIEIRPMYAAEDFAELPH